MTQQNGRMKGLLKLIKNEYASCASDGIPTGDVTSFIDTGSYTLNAVCGGSLFSGIPTNKIVEFCGLSSTGKTFFCLSVARQFLESSDNSVVVYFDSESALRKDFVEGLNVDSSRLLVAPVATIEEFRDQSIAILNDYNALPKDEKYPIMFILDSLGNMSTEKEMGDADKGSNAADMGAKAKIVKAVFRVLTLKLSKANAALLFTNHTYTKVGDMHAQQVAGGGSGPAYLASIIVELTRRKETDKDNRVIGHIVHCKNKKNRLSQENLVLDTLITYENGINRYYGLVPIAIKTGVFKKSSTFVELPDGKKVYESAINKNPEKYFTPEILKEIDRLAQPLFQYGNNVDDEPEEEIKEIIKEMEENNGGQE